MYKKKEQVELKAYLEDVSLDLIEQGVEKEVAIEHNHYDLLAYTAVAMTASFLF